MTQKREDNYFIMQTYTQLSPSLPRKPQMKGISKTPPSHLPAQSPRAADCSASSLLAGKSNIFQLICMTKAHIFRVEKKKKKKDVSIFKRQKRNTMNRLIIPVDFIPTTHKQSTNFLLDHMQYKKTLTNMNS